MLHIGSVSINKIVGEIVNKFYLYHDCCSDSLAHKAMDICIRISIPYISTSEKKHLRPRVYIQFIT